MKFLILVMLLLCGEIISYAQEISMVLNGATLDEFVSTIQKTTDYSFVYGEDVRFDKPVNIDVKNAPLKDVLERVLERNGIQFKVNKKHVMLFKLKDSSGKNVTISGYVIDAQSHETLIGATIYSLNDRKGTTSNSYGFFSLTLPSDATMLNVSYIGYESKAMSMKMEKDTTIVIKLETNNHIEEIVVESTRPETGVTSSRTGAVAMSMETVKSMPAFLGEPDVLKALQVMPSVQKGVSGTSIMTVRGGNRDQNLYLLDGVPFYNVDHLFGFISAFTPDATKRVDFFASSFPSRYGGRLSSVIDVRTKDGDMNNYHGSLTLGTITSHLTLEGPVCDDQTSFILSARRSLVDKLLPMRFNFYDINAKVNHIFSEYDRIYASFYMGRDNMNEEMSYLEYNSEINPTEKKDVTDDAGLGWGNTMGSLRWNHVFNKKVFGNMTMARNKFYFNCLYNGESVVRKIQDNTLVMRIKDDMETSSKIDDWIVMYDIDYNPNHSNHIKMGVQYTNHRFRPDKSYLSHTIENADTTMTVSRGHGSIKRIGNETDVYMEDDLTIGKHFDANIGVRVPLFAVEDKLYKSIEPRVSLTLKAGRGWRLKGAYTKMHQYVHQLTTGKVSMPADLWMPISKKVEPMCSDMFVAGLNYSGFDGWEAVAEAYYKEMNHILDYQDGYGYNNSADDWEKIVASGKGRAKGIELTLRRTKGVVTGLACYALSKSDRKFDRTINGGSWFPADYDRRHKLNINTNWHINERFDVAVAWAYSSGATATIARYMTNYYFGGEHTSEFWRLNTYTYFGGRNNYRLPSTHSLDISFKAHRQRKWFRRTIAVGVMNAYNRHNVDWAYTDYVWSESKQCTDVVIKTMCMLPILPSFSYTMTF